MTEKNDGGPAFPGAAVVDMPDMVDPDTGETMSWVRGRQEFPGLSLRDYCAIHADISNAEFPTMAEAQKFMGEETVVLDLVAQMAFGARLAARLRYIAADAMISERNK